MKGAIRTFKLNFYINHFELLFMVKKNATMRKKALCSFSNTVGAE